MIGRSYSSEMKSGLSDVKAFSGTLTFFFSLSSNPKLAISLSNILRLIIS